MEVLSSPLFTLRKGKRVLDLRVVPDTRRETQCDTKSSRPRQSPEGLNTLKLRYDVLDSRDRFSKIFISSVV